MFLGPFKVEDVDTLRPIRKQRFANIAAAFFGGYEWGAKHPDRDFRVLDITHTPIPRSRAGGYL